MRASLYWHCLKRLLRHPPPPAVFLNLFAYLTNKLFFRKTVLNFHPMSMVIYLTKRCNYSCSFCYAKDSLDARNFKNDLTMAQLKDLLATPFGRKALRVGLLGGEPFLNPEIFDFIRELKSHGKILTVVSNASLIGGDRLKKLIDSDLDVLGLSLYDNNRSHVERVVRAIEGRMSYWVQTVVDSKTISQLESTMQFLADIGCRNLQISNCVPIGDMDKDLAIYDDNLEYLEAERRLKEKFGKKMNISWVQLLPRKKTRRACAMPFSYVHVDNTGNLGACCMRAPDGEKFGNVYRDKDAWNLPYYRDLRASMLDENLEALDVCRRCDILHQDLYRI